MVIMTSKKSATLENISLAATEKGQEEGILLSRRLSLGDKPISVSKNLTIEEKFFLGRAGADPPQHFDHVEQNGKSECRHRICITEVAPSHSSIIGANKENGDWQMSINEFTSKKKGKNSRQGMPKRVRAFYKAQDELIDKYEEMLLDVDDAMENAEEARKLQRTASILSKLTLAANVVLLAVKMVASILSGSISIISSLVDSFVDLASGIVITVATQAMARRNPYEYPQGRTKLEPIAIVILSVIMSLASLQLIRESIEKIVGLADGTASVPDVTIPTIVITVSAIVIKLVLYLVSRRSLSPSVQALAMDHRNDVISNTFALIFGYVGSEDMQNKTHVRALVYLDAVGAILISIYIAINWYMTGYDQIKNLTGHTAKPDFLKKLTWLAVNHHPKLQYVDTVRAFHFGTNFLVEVDIVLPEDMSLREAHDIGEPLQQKLERLPEVERAFVHLDYEFEHRPFDEHKQV